MAPSSLYSVVTYELVGISTRVVVKVEANLPVRAEYIAGRCDLERIRGPGHLTVYT